MAKSRVFYNIVPTHDPDFFHVHKLNEDFEPLASYKTSTARLRFRCDCPSYKRPCKHAKMVASFQKEGAPEGKLWDEISNGFIDNPNRIGDYDAE